MTAAITVTWSLSGADRSKFDISEDDGVLTFKTGSLPNYEMPGDADMDNVYEVTVVATAGSHGPQHGRNQGCQGHGH